MAAPQIVGPRCNVIVTGSLPGAQLADSRYDGYLAVDPLDAYRMFGVCRHFSGQGINYQDVLEAQFTLDGGLTWSTSPLPLQPNMYSISDPWIGVTRSMFFSSEWQVGVLGTPLRTPDGSTDGSQANAQTLLTNPYTGAGVNFYSNIDPLLNQGSWALAEIVTYQQADGSDQTFGGVDQNLNSPFHGRIYAIWMHYGANGYRSLAFAFSNDGLNWNHSGNSPNVPVGSATFFDLNQSWDLINMAVGPDGHIHLIGFTNTTFYYGTSADGGNTFQFGVIASQQPIGSVGAAFTGSTPATRNPPCIFAGADGLVIAAWTVNTAEPGSAAKARICFAICSDNGASWLASGPTGVAQGLGLPFLPLGDLPDTSADQYFMPRLAGAPGGTVGCVFSHCQLVGDGTALSANFSTHLSVSLGFVVPRSPKYRFPEVVPYFAPLSTTTVQVSDQVTSLIASSNPVFRWGDQSAFFIGDFLGLCASSFGFFPYWSDTRSGSGQLVTSRLALNPCSVFIRHFASDTGNLEPPPSGQAVSDAPDLIVRFQPDGDTNFVNELIWPGTPPQDLYVYGRIFNQGPAAALNVTLSVVLARFQGDQVLNLPSIYPQDFFTQDWALPSVSYLSSRASPGAAWVASVPANSWAILGPVIVPVKMVPWAQVSFGPDGFSFVGLLARVHVDNDDGNGGTGNGCPKFFISFGPGQTESYFMQTNKATQRWLFSLGLAISIPGQ